MINADIHIHDLKTLFIYMPKLKYLTIGLKESYYDQKWNKEEKQQPFAPQLEEIELRLNDNIDHNQIISLLTESTAINLKTIIIYYESLYNVDEILIEILFRSAFPLSKTFEIKFPRETYYGFIFFNYFPFHEVS
ncbi:unnamed protein product [Didymodactylos carnosus]|uniref:Uncharacterized protein n=1 Tax=Didymodactylos carnosus TaxID=1234261 RepID=A0A815NB50_9BILA|nr:unnamed protein product [Didymodactylos carnosus]CAF1434135.1 unnamed protein product [Didymodactylos carnosus]CAF3701960.1 unnamed protein product [Didymodactylos carnosus]CAF4312037.1 unnamed protein product [Didymodactylos carnosus]